MISKILKFKFGTRITTRTDKRTETGTITVYDRPAPEENKELKLVGKLKKYQNNPLIVKI